jgi:hypothetical protein
MRKLLMGLAILSSLAVAGVSQAANGVVDMRWDSCTGPVDKTTAVAGPANLYISELGLDQVHTAYDVRVIYGNASQTVPDAWRFDTGGCEDGLFTMDATLKSCPAFAQTANGSALQIKKVEFSPPFEQYATTLIRVIFAVAYANTPITPVPATRYLLGHFNFDLSAAVPGPSDPGVTCGGYGDPMCIKLSHAGWLDTNGIEQAFDRADPALSVSFNGASACPAVPVQAKTWGAIKGQYRN